MSGECSQVARQPIVVAVAQKRLDALVRPSPDGHSSRQHPSSSAKELREDRQSPCDTAAIQSLSPRMPHTPGKKAGGYQLGAPGSLPPPPRF